MTDSVVNRPKVGIVVLNYQTAEDTTRCLESLAEVTYEPLEIRVVDNASSAECVRRLEQAVQRRGVTLIRNGTNAGYAAGNNVGIRALLEAGCEHVLVLNNDTIVPPGFLEPLVAALEADPRAALVMPRFLDEDGRDETPIRYRPSFASYFWEFGVVLAARRFFGRIRSAEPPTIAGEPREIEVPCGACMLMRAGFLRDIGLLDEGTFLYHEEMILAEQVRERGLRMLLVPDSSVVHLGGRTTRHVRLRSAVALWKSQNYYLKRYRRVDPVRRGLLIAYHLASWPVLEAVAFVRAAAGRVRRRLAGTRRPPGLMTGSTHAR